MPFPVADNKTKIARGVDNIENPALILSHIPIATLVAVPVNIHRPIYNARTIGISILSFTLSYLHFFLFSFYPSIKATREHGFNTLSVDL